ncbi:MAG: flagellar biosynthesis protein FlhB [Dehalococcoidia bacterium]
MAHARTEQPTRKRLDDARKKGQVARSREVDTAFALLAAFAVFRFGGAALWRSMEALLVDSFAVLDRDDLVTMDLTASMGTELIMRALLMLLPLLIAVLVIGLVGGFVQTGFIFSAQAAKPQFSRMNPIKGAQRIFFSKQTVVQLGKSLGKVAIVGGVAGATLWQRMDEVEALGLSSGLLPSLGTVADIAFSITLRSAMALLAIAAADYVFQRYDWMSQLKMTRQEVRDEMRQTEGDPQIRSRIAQLRRSFMARVLSAVPKADVVLTNPTHYAVALKYDPTADQAPKVIAKGERLMALRIREVAAEHGIPIIENPPLTRAIYRAVPVNQEITPDLYEAVAEILAFVYRLRFARAAAV